MAQQKEKQVFIKRSDIPRNSHFREWPKDGTRKNKGSKGLANTQNSKGGTSFLEIHQLLSMVHIQLQLIYNTSHQANEKGSDF